MIENILRKFKDGGIPIQITIDIDKPVTVHAFDLLKDLHKTSDTTLLGALNKMAEKLL
jgi:hypothetical protein